MVPNGIRIEVKTEELSGDFVAIQWYRRYRLTVTAIPTGTYVLRLHWQNDFQAPSYRSRMLVDTVVTIP